MTFLAPAPNGRGRTAVPSAAHAAATSVGGPHSIVRREPESGELVSQVGA
jgi:hypothetical protein